jgi:serine---pyruvate transaminase
MDTSEMKHLLFTPGPTNLPPEVLAALGQPIVHHRSPDFAPIFKAAREGLQYVFRTRNPVVPLTASGTGGMEAAVTGLLSPGDKAIAIAGGKFGARWGEICEAFGIECIVEQIDWSTAATPEMVERLLTRHPDAKAVFTTHCETSSGSLTDVAGIGWVVARTEAVLVVDAISSLGAEPLETDLWGLDIVVSASQKALMLPPGMAFVSVSPKAEAMVRSARCASFYFSLRKALDALAENTTPWTSPISMIVALNAALDLIRQTGIEAVWERHRRFALAIRSGCAALGLSLFSEVPSCAVTALRVPDGVDAAKLVRAMRDDFGITIAGGQAHLKGRIIRIAALGHVEEAEVLALIAALEKALRQQGHAFEEGSGMSAVQKSLNEIRAN